MNSTRPADYWLHRRAMTGLTIIAGLFVFPIMCWLSPALMGLAGMFYTLVCTVVAAYMGTSLFDDKWVRSNSSQQSPTPKKTD